MILSKCTFLKYSNLQNSLMSWYISRVVGLGDGAGANILTRSNSFRLWKQIAHYHQQRRHDHHHHHDNDHHHHDHDDDRDQNDQVCDQPPKSYPRLDRNQPDKLEGKPQCSHQNEGTILLMAIKHPQLGRRKTWLGVLRAVC